MKFVLPLFLIGAILAAAEAETDVSFIRQQQQATGVVWDMPVAPAEQPPSALLNNKGGTLLQLWNIEQEDARDHLVDQKIVGPYLPVVDIKMKTLDPYKPVARTRVDQPFIVEINVTGLLTGDGFPKSATNVVLERHVASFAEGENALYPAAVISGAPFRSAYINTNGATILKFPASALTARDPTTAAGEEHFVIHAISDGSLSQTQLASGFVQVWPIASGSIKGIAKGDVLHFEAPQIELVLNDLYPRSDTSLMLFEGTQINGVQGTTINSFPMNREICESHVITVDELDTHISGNGTYTLALMSDTIYGRELLCDPVTFSVKRETPTAMAQVNASN